MKPIWEQATATGLHGREAEQWTKAGSSASLRNDKQGDRQRQRRDAGVLRFAQNDTDFDVALGMTLFSLSDTGLVEIRRNWKGLGRLC
jgi:hypothetical protein